MPALMLAAYMLFTPLVMDGPVVRPDHYGQDVIVTARGAYYSGEDFELGQNRTIILPTSARLILDIKSALSLTYVDGHYEAVGTYIREGYFYPETMPLPNPILATGWMEVWIGRDCILFTRYE